MTNITIKGINPKTGEQYNIDIRQDSSTFKAYENWLKGDDIDATSIGNVILPLLHVDPNSKNNVERIPLDILSSGIKGHTYKLNCTRKEDNVPEEVTLKVNKILEENIFSRFDKINHMYAIMEPVAANFKFLYYIGYYDIESKVDNRMFFIGMDSVLKSVKRVLERGSGSSIIDKTWAIIMARKVIENGLNNNYIYLDIDLDNIIIVPSNDTESVMKSIDLNEVLCERQSIHKLSNHILLDNDKISHMIGQLLLYASFREIKKVRNDTYYKLLYGFFYESVDSGTYVFPEVNNWMRLDNIEHYYSIISDKFEGGKYLVYNYLEILLREALGEKPSSVNFILLIDEYIKDHDEMVKRFGSKSKIDIKKNKKRDFTDEEYDLLRKSFFNVKEMRKIKTEIDIEGFKKEIKSLFSQRVYDEDIQ